MIRSSFFGLNLGYKGVAAQQRALDVTGHNIANANTEGFSRQRAVMVTDLPMYTANGYIGSGVDIINVERIRDKFLDQQFRNETNVKGYWDTTYDAFAKIEAILNEPRDASLRTAMDQFWASWQDLSKEPESSAIRTTVIQKGITLTDNFNKLHDQLDLLKKDIGFNIENQVIDINSIAARVADLNLQIIRSESDGRKANDLRDRRDLLVEQLSGIANLGLSEDSKGSLNIFIGGQALVFVNNVNKVETVPREDGLFDVRWQNGSEFLVRNGALKGLLDARDTTTKKYMDQMDEIASALAKFTNAAHETGFGLNGVSDTGIPFFTVLGGDVGKLATGTGNQTWPAAPATNGVAPIASAMNKGEQLNGLTIAFATGGGPGITSGYDVGTKTLTLSAADWSTTDLTESDIQKIINDALAAEGFTDQVYLNMRGAKSADIVDGTAILLGGGTAPTAPITAKNIQVNRILIDDITKLAAAKAPVTDPENGAGDAANAIRLAQIKYNNRALKEATIDDYYRSMIGDIGINTSKSENMVRNQQLLVTQISTQREYTMGVSLDEEMTHMIQFQQAYNSSARFLTAVDEMLDVLVNRLGRVGN